MSTKSQGLVGVSRPTFFQRTQLLVLVLLLLGIPLGLCNHPLGGAFSTGLFVIVIFFFPGYLLLAITDTDSNGIGLAISPVVGIVCLTTLYDIFARASLDRCFFYLTAALCLIGMVVFVVRGRRKSVWWSSEGHRAVMAGCVTALSVAPLYWRSGRFSDGEFVFRGPAGQDPLFHVALLQRLYYHVPPDNVIVSGLRQGVYHYFNDLTLAMILRMLHSSANVSLGDVMDLYYRFYPTLIYFLLGVLAYLAGRQIAGTVKGGVLGVLLLLGGGGLGWIVGSLQTIIHAPHFTDLQERLFSSWSTWDGVDGLRSLVHRAANYEGLLIGLAAINILLFPQRARRHWMMAGLLLGLMAGFNYPLAATFGAAAVLATLLFLLRRRQGEAGNLALLAVFIFLGSLPLNATILWSGLHNSTPGSPFLGPNLEYPDSIWGAWLGRIVPAALVPLAALILYPIFAYGIRLFGVAALAQLDLGAPRYRGVALMLSLAFAIMFVIGTFFPLQETHVGYIFVQPTLWILAFFAVRPIAAWLERGRPRWRAFALWGILGLTWVQALLAYNFCYKVAFGKETFRVFQDLRSTTSADDVVAYVPGGIKQTGVLSYTQESTNFAVIAMTGLDGYFLSPSYTRIAATAGLAGKTAQEVRDKADYLYKQRLTDVESFLKGDLDTAGSARLKNDRVRWILALRDSTAQISTAATPWRRTQEITVYRLPP